MAVTGWTHMTVRWRALVAVAAVLAGAYVVEEVVRTLRILDQVEAQRDSWQRPDAILAPLDLHPGETVVDLGSGAGYFALKIAARVGSTGRVLAADLRRESLAFLWLRARRNGLPNVEVIVATFDDPRVPAGAADAVLIANTYHEFTDAAPILERLSAALRGGGRLVIADRAPRSTEREAAEHDIAADTVIEQVTRHGFDLALRDDALIAQDPDGHAWWLLAFDKR